MERSESLTSGICFLINRNKTVYNNSSGSDRLNNKFIVETTARGYAISLLFAVGNEVDFLGQTLFKTENIKSLRNIERMGRTRNK
jgi:hypothetical protein